MREREAAVGTGQTRPRSPSEALEPTRAPARPRRRRRPPSRRLSGLTRLLSGILTVSLAAMVIAGVGLIWIYHEFERAGPLTVSRTFGVPRGEGPIEIATRLEREGIISNRWAFVASHTLKKLASRGRAEHLKAGEYEFKKGASMSEVLAVLVEGKSILLKITLPEGLTSAQIVERLKADENLSGEITQIPPEGSLLPDTYRFSKGMDRQELVERMQAEQKRYLAGIWEKRQPDLPISTPEEALTLASIVEKETGRADERERVAAVFVNRLRKGMRLQSDPTIIYGLVGGQGSLGRPITRSDIDSKTAYNTYQIKGLPPGPICNPGRSAIAATLDPAATADLYFVADGSGGHRFSENLKDHNAAVANWRKVEQERRDKAADAAPTKEGEAAGAEPGGAGEQPPVPVTGSATRAVVREAPAADAAAGGQAAASGEPKLPTVVKLNGAGAAAPAASADQQPAATAEQAADAMGGAAADGIPIPTRKPKQR